MTETQAIIAAFFVVGPSLFLATVMYGTYLNNKEEERREQEDRH